MSSMKIEIKDDRAMVFTPYNKDFVAQIKLIDGRRWDSERRCWTVPAECVEDVRSIMMDVYGETDIPNGEEKLIVKVSFQDYFSGLCEDAVLFGKTLAHATGRDSGARPGKDVSYIKGAPSSGGSRANWESCVDPGCVVILHNVTKALWERDKDGGKVYTAEIIEPQAVDRDALRTEREKLMARIAEIDRILGEEGA